MEKKKRKATKGQRERIEGMLKSGLIDRNEAKEIIQTRRFAHESITTASWNKYLWERHSSCAGIREFAEGGFETMCVPKKFVGTRLDQCWEGLAEHYARKGLRFALIEEADNFEGSTRGYLVLGSTALDAVGLRFVPSLYDWSVLAGCGRDMKRVSLDHPLGSDDLLLLVRMR